MSVQGDATCVSERRKCVLLVSVVFFGRTPLFGLPRLVLSVSGVLLVDLLHLVVVSGPEFRPSPLVGGFSGVAVGLVGWRFFPEGRV